MVLTREKTKYENNFQIFQPVVKLISINFFIVCHENLEFHSILSDRVVFGGEEKQR